jgi:hypothetical protein
MNSAAAILPPIDLVYARTFGYQLESYEKQLGRGWNRAR